MNILGISTFGVNPAACLVQDGTLRAFCHEERFTRLKISAGHFPTHAVNWCFKSRGLRLGDIDRIAVSWDCTKYPWRMLRHLARVKLALSRAAHADASSLTYANRQVGAWQYLLSHTPSAFEQGIRDHLRDAGHRGPIPKIRFIPHHECHAFQAFFQSPYCRAAVVVLDGSGEETTTTAWLFDPQGYRRLFHFDVPQSLGWYYAAFTAYLGFHANRDEGKLMGLAALGESRRAANPWLERLERIIRVGPAGFEIDPTFVKFGGNEYHARFTDHLRAFVIGFDKRLEPVAVGEMAEVDGLRQYRYLLPEYVDLAFAAQDRLEHAMVAVVRRAVRESGCRQVCLAGGVAMNCKANGRILNEAGIDSIFIHPASSDDGASIGAAFHVARHEDHLLSNPLLHAQWGPAFEDDEIAAALRGCGLTFEQPEDIAEATAGLLAERKLIGWFQGGVEMGARALGGRSVVAWAGDPDTKHRVNRRVKFREEWRPFCPSMTAESRQLYVEDAVETPFMILARTATARLRERAAATVHVDGSIRPQTVSAEAQPRWHTLLEMVGKKTGDPVVLNTSLNIGSEPIVCTPHDAIRCFFGSGLDALAIGSFLLRKPNS